MFTVTDSLSEPGNASKPNEDYIFRGETCIAVIDGATNLNGSEYGGHDFVRDFSKHFEKRIRSLPLPKAINAAVADLYKEKLGGKPEPKDIALYSSAAAVFAHEVDGKIRFLALGDCSAMVFLRDGTMQKVCTTALDAIDDTVINRLRALHEQTGADVAELLKTDEIKTMLIQNRKKMNTVGGYKSLSFTLPELDDDEVTEFSAADIDRVIMYSDGFQSMERDILAGVPFGDLYKALRARENSDRSLNADPRFKISDDASIISFTV